MIKSIRLLCADAIEQCNFIKQNAYKVVIDYNVDEALPMTLQIVFNHNISHFRNHDYTWANTEENRVANWYAPKLLKLDNGQLVQANQNRGIWEIVPKEPNVLLWHFGKKDANPIASYDTKNHTHIIQAKIEILLREQLALLFPRQKGLEMSRSKVPFSAIVCFTDHCDFDTLDNLIEQRQFFKKHKVKVTKGIFLYNYSKRKDTASYELHRQEIDAWVKDGHELAYHSLSQSIKPKFESLDDFISFEPPNDNMTTWIDHGFQPYNFTILNGKNREEINYDQVFRDKNIHNLWNYLDSGTSVSGVINQINPKQFTLGQYYRGIKHLGKKTALRLLIKAIVFHYITDFKGLYLYKQIARFLKTKREKKEVKKWKSFIINMVALFSKIFPILIFWRFHKKITFPLAKYGPLFFNHNIDGKSFKIFQTIEMINFKEALCQKNIDSLIAEKGVFIAHTYFSAPLNYHEGRLFYKENDIDTKVDEKFAYLSTKIQTSEIWNPTLKEMIKYMQPLEDVIFDCNDHGEVFIKSVATDKFVSRAIE